MRWGVERKLSSEQYTNEIEITKVYIDSSKSLLTISTVFITASLAIAQYLKWFETTPIFALMVLPLACWGLSMIFGVMYHVGSVGRLEILGEYNNELIKYDTQRAKSFSTFDRFRRQLVQHAHLLYNLTISLFLLGLFSYTCIVIIYLFLLSAIKV